MCGHGEGNWLLDLPVLSGPEPFSFSPMGFQLACCTPPPPFANDVPPSLPQSLKPCFLTNSLLVVSPAEQAEV